MNKCDNYQIPCPYALSQEAREGAGLPCFGGQTNCDMWRTKYKREVTDALPPEEASKLEKQLLGLE